MTFHLRSNEALADGLRRIASEQIRIALCHIDDSAIPQDTKVHSLRKRCKKMRGLLRLAKPLAEDVFEIEDQKFRAAGKQLAANRDADVYVKTVRSLTGADVEVESPRHAVFGSAIDNSRKILEECLDDVEYWPLDVEGFVDIGPGFARTYRHCVGAWGEVLRNPADEKFHRLRKWTKYHWYQVRILERLNKGEMRERRQALRKLQLDLGDAHDLYVLQTILASNARPDMQLLERAIARKHELYADVIGQGQELFSLSPDELVARCATWWVEWHQHSGVVKPIRHTPL
jgi:CHAD domain-containing protein